MPGTRGYCAIGIAGAKNTVNVGTLWRSANILGAAYIFTIGQRYRHQPSDVLKTPRHIPLFTWPSFEAFYGNLPYDARLVGIEMAEGAEEIGTYRHPERAVYLLGAEDAGLPPSIMKRCHDLIRLPGTLSLNVATAGSLVLFDRHQKSRSLTASALPAHAATAP